MSWIPFRKVGTKKVDQLVDNEFNNQVDKFNQVEMSTRKMYKDMKRYIEDNNGLIKAENRLGQDLLACAISIENEEILNETAKSVQEVLQNQSELHSELNENLQKIFVEPMKKFTSNFNCVSNAIKRREQSLQEYRKYQLKHEKFMEKEGQTQSGKFDANERYLGLAKLDFERRNAKLLEELPNFFDCRIMYFQPCFEGLIKCQHSYYKQSRDLFEELANKIDCPLEQRSDEDYREETNKRLLEMKSLSIVAER